MACEFHKFQHHEYHRQTYLVKEDESCNVTVRHPQYQMA